MRKLLVPLVLLLAACGDEQNLEPPAELVDIAAQVEIRRAWSQNLGGRSDYLRLALRPAVVDGILYAGAFNGEVIAVDAASGRRVWRTATRRPLSAGPGVGDGLVVFGSSDGEVIALDAGTGEVRWRQPVSSEVLARPLVSEGAAIVRTVDGRLQSLSLTDGSQRWVIQEAVPALSLRGTAPAIRAGDVVLAGFDNGKIVALDFRSGDLLWDVTVSAPSGRTELERLVDLDAAVRVAGEDVFVVGFQGRAAMLALDSGQIWWARELSSYRGFTLDDANLYVTNAEGGVVALSRRDGSVVWEQLTALRMRGLTAPELDGEAIVVGDFEGYLHWLDRRTGEIIGRVRAGRDRITNVPLVVDGTVYVQTDAGNVQALRSSPREAAR